ncbi:GNAT family N-acetyltransferase [Flindersiella endophytica]
MLARSLGDDGAELRPLEPWQAEEFLTHMDRAREQVSRYIGLADAVSDLASSRAYLQSYADKTAADTGRIWGIWADGKLVGGVLFRVMDVVRSSAEAGCWLEPAAVGRGLVTRAARAIIDWAIEERGFHRVEWVAATDNQASIAVARRLGMQKEGVLRENYPHRGTRLTSEIWSVLASEWRTAKRAG